MVWFFQRFLGPIYPSTKSHITTSTTYR
jgi:hypothetical protein